MDLILKQNKIHSKVLRVLIHIRKVSAQIISDFHLFYKMISTGFGRTTEIYESSTPELFQPAFNTLNRGVELFRIERSPFP